jgi:hypothetical protein
VLLKRLLLLFPLLLLGASSAQAAFVATVEAVRAPAWVEHRGSEAPLYPGLDLAAGDRIRTGPGGRVLLRLAEGSQVRLGAKAIFVLVKLDAPTDEDSLFTGLLRVARGAFRFTTTLLSRSHRRSLNIQIATVNAGISGTDVWAKAADDRDIVCLIEGRITVAQGDSEPTSLVDPLSFYVAPKDAPPKPVASVTPEQLEKWVAQVALETGTGVITGGPWAVALNSFRKEARAARALTALRDVGIPAQIVPVTVQGVRWQRLVVAGFDSQSEAMAFAHRARELAGVSGAWAYRL